MKKLAIIVACIALAACSGSAADTTPVISNLTLATPVVAGAVSTGQVAVSNAAGLSGLTLQIAITAPTGGTTTSTTPVLDSSSVTEGDVDVLFELAPGAPSGTYSLTLTVLDGSDASNALTTTFDVGGASSPEAGSIATPSDPSCAALAACCMSPSYPATDTSLCLEAASSGNAAGCQTALAEYNQLGICGASTADAG